MSGQLGQPSRLRLVLPGDRQLLQVGLPQERAVRLVLADDLAQKPVPGPARVVGEQVQKPGLLRVGIEAALPAARDRGLRNRQATNSRQRRRWPLVRSMVCRRLLVSDFRSFQRKAISVR